MPVATRAKAAHDERMHRFLRAWLQERQAGVQVPTQVPVRTARRNIRKIQLLCLLSRVFRNDTLLHITHIVFHRGCGRLVPLRQKGRRRHTRAEMLLHSLAKHVGRYSCLISRLLCPLQRAKRLDPRLAHGGRCLHEEKAHASLGAPPTRR